MSVGVLDQEVDSSYIFFVFKDMKVRKRVNVIKIYRKKLRRVN